MDDKPKAKTLVEKVREEIGSETLAKLAEQPLCIANGGMEAVLQTACDRVANYPRQLAAAVREVRVMCGSKAKK